MAQPAPHRQIKTLQTLVQRLALLQEKPLRVWQAARETFDQVSPLRELPAGAGDQPPPEIQYPRDQVAADRNCDFSRCRWCWSPSIRSEIDKGGIGFMPHRRYQGNLRGRSGADHDFFVESPEIFQAAPAARDNPQFGWRRRPRSRQAVEALDRRGDLLGSTLPLHQYRPDQNAPGKAFLQAMENVADHGAGRRSHDANDFRKKGQGALALLGKEPFGG